MSRWSSDLEHSHHSVILVIEDVAVEHPLAGEVVESHDEPDGLVPGNVDRVLPTRKGLGHAVPIENLKLESVQMEGVIHADEILDRPDFGGAQPGAFVHAGHVHRAAVDEALAERDD